ncbi:glycoside hydrolase 43 family protein [Bailinhaonella thermotolerans]|uniref:Glycoside hydrolase n=1 Tax=Bailinhaonella thermotolerans TaxID=1070861 RepID=A0A3A4A7X5_9ACTN|nr:glycoside hydrolase 43 family protein [Bailinhaonella thermotolerans]RJL24705.1 glycoside hydrolase [Bailinhaonella thermotolerans]
MTAPWIADNGDGTYTNPVLDADWPDPDVIAVGDDFYLTASSFTKVPGLPILHSKDLVNWTIAGHAVTRGRDEPRPGHGVWAPSLRFHDGRFWIFYGDPDEGIFVVTADRPEGPWREPYLIKKGAGLIDPCPLWDEDGRAYLVHAWAKSRAGFNNRLTLHEMTPDATALLGPGRVVIDGDRVPGCFTLEGPKLYRRDGWYWILAPAGGVATGWQYAFRSRDVAGPYEPRIVLERGGTAVNGPHQGAWVRAGDADWFLHFQDRGAYGRVVHLQPMRWGPDGWPVIGDGGRPVPGGRKPVQGHPPAAPRSDDDFTGAAPGPQWSWPANPDPSWWSTGAGHLRLTCRPGPEDLRLRPDVLTQRLPARAFSATTAISLGDGARGRAGLAVLGDEYAWAGLDGDLLVCRAAGAGGPERDLAAPVPAGEGPVTVTVTVEDGALCRFSAVSAAGREVGGRFRAAPSQWVGAVLALFASGEEGHARFHGFSTKGTAP